MPLPIHRRRGGIATGRHSSSAYWWLSKGAEQVLHVHRAERADRLADGLAGVLAEPLRDPMTAEIVAVHSRGIERWLAQELSCRLGVGIGRADGVCANVDFPFPGRLVARVVGEVCPVEADEDPWRPERLVWPVLEEAIACATQDWMAPLRAHVAATGAQDAPGRSRRFGTARHIADLFDRYAVHRPQLIEAWAPPTTKMVNAAGEGLPTDLVWQPRLWRQVRDRLGVPSVAERLKTAVARLRDGAAAGVPERVSLFGLTALPASYVDVLAALATSCEVHLFLLHPSGALWDALDATARPGHGAPPARDQDPTRDATAHPPLPARDQDPTRDATAHPPLPARDQDPTREAPTHPLLRSWGRDAREMQLVLARATDARDRHLPLADPQPSPEGSTTLLERLQGGIRADRSPPGPPSPRATDERPTLGSEDRSVQVHACHGRTRQVEVLRDAILHLLAADPDLEPRDIVVMCPDIETFAPLVHAVFGAQAVTEQEPSLATADVASSGSAPVAPTGSAPVAPTGSAPVAPIGSAPVAPIGSAPAVDGAASGGEHDRAPLPDLRVRLADRSLRQTNPLLRVVAELLTLADARLTASEVLGLAGREPVRRRFRFDDDELERLAEWVSGTGIRWGLDGSHRAAFGLDGVHANSWRAGLDRLLAGVAVADEALRMVDGVVPYDDVEGEGVELAGRFAEFVQRLAAALAALERPQPIDGWAEAIREAADVLTATAEHELWQEFQLHRLLEGVVEEARTGEETPCPVPLTLADVRVLLEDRLRGRPSRANHRTGDLVVCTLVPMRSVPHRVVCLLGMDDGAFPRRTAADGDDLVDRDPRVGDRDPRTEDRQLLLDAVLSATDTLVVVYTGRDERTNEPRPPAVPVGELLDTIDRTARAPDGGPARRHVVMEHPLHASDPRNFIADTVDGRPWGFDATALAGARARASGSHPQGPFLPEPLPPDDDLGILALDDLVRFLEHPVRTFLRDRLGVRLATVGEEPTDAIPVELGGLERYEIGDRLLQARLGAADPDRWAALERARGTLPPGALAERELADLQETISALLAAAGEHADLRTPATAVDIDVPLAGGRSLLGTVAGLLGDTILVLQYSRVAPKHRLGAWARLLAATAARPERPLRSVVIGRCRSAQRKAQVTVACAGPLGPTSTQRRERALELLGRLADLHASGLREPLPLYCRTSAAYAEAARDGKDPHPAARSEWTTGWMFSKEDQEPEHVLVLGGAVPFGQLLEEPPCPGEDGDGLADADPSRFGRYARRLWDDLLACEEVVDH